MRKASTLVAGEPQGHMAGWMAELVLETRSVWQQATVLKIATLMQDTALASLSVSSIQTRCLWHLCLKCNWIHKEASRVQAGLWLQECNLLGQYPLLRWGLHRDLCKGTWGQCGASPSEAQNQKHRRVGFFRENSWGLDSLVNFKTVSERKELFERSHAPSGSDWREH